MTDWNDCFDNRWDSKMVTENTRIHFAKFPINLIFRIYSNAMRLGYLGKGSRVLDPFAGIALGAAPAMAQRMEWVGVEVEPHYVKIGRANIKIWKKVHWRHSHTNTILLLGDSSHLHRYVDGEFDAIVSSPPYQGVAVRALLDKKSRIAYADTHGIDTQCVSMIDLGKQVCPTQEYGDSTGQLGALDSQMYWKAVTSILQGVVAALRDGGAAIWVTKDSVRDGAIHPFTDQWIAACEYVGLRVVRRHRAMRKVVHGSQLSLLRGQEPVEHFTQHKGYFRILNEGKGSPCVDWEDITVMEK